MKSSISSTAGLLGAIGFISGCASGAANHHHEHSHPAPPAATAPVAAVAAPAAPPPQAQASPAAFRQLPELPQKSPSAQVRQEVGITGIEVVYSSPAARGRNVWGELVPYGEKWRTGANAPTRISFEHDVTVGGKAVPAGSYAIFTIPTAAKWTVILNKDPKSEGVFAHDQAQDVARLELATTEAPPRERLTFLFEDTSDEGTKLVLDWAGKRLAIPIAVDTKAHVKKSIDETMGAAWRPLFNAGRYALDDQNDPARALLLFEKSISIHASWWNHWWTATTLQKLGRHAEARQHAEKAKALGKGDAVYQRAFAEQIDKALAEWPKS
jgi:hypothetical protein